jgi:hypothetical protein
MKISFHDKFFSLNLFHKIRQIVRIRKQLVQLKEKLHPEENSYFSPVKLLLRYSSMNESESFKAFRARTP